jgi:hypothetical protein
MLPKQLDFASFSFDLLPISFDVIPRLDLHARCDGQSENRPMMDAPMDQRFPREANSAPGGQGF